MSDEFWIKLNSNTDIEKVTEEVTEETEEFESSTAGFPSDDSLTLQQIADGGNLGLDRYYGALFKDNEVAFCTGSYAEDAHDGIPPVTICDYQLQFVPIVGSPILSIFHNEVVIQTAIANLDGTFNIQNIPQLPAVRVISGNIVENAIALSWTANPMNSHLVVSYEYQDDPQVAIRNKKKKENKKLYADLAKELQETKDKLNELQNLEADLYEEFDQKVKQCKDFMVKKIDQFLTMKDPEYILNRTPQQIFDEAVGNDMK